MQMNDCPKYVGCSAAICPLDVGWWATHRIHGPGDRMCLYLSEIGKDGGRERIANLYESGADIIAACEVVIYQLQIMRKNMDDMPRGLGTLLNSLNASWERPSSIEAGKRAGERMAAARASRTDENIP